MKSLFRRRAPIPMTFTQPLNLIKIFFLCAALIPLGRAAAMVHPGISHSQADLDRMKNNINVEPYKTAFAAFSSNGYAQYTNTGQGAVVAETYGVGQFQIRNDAAVCHYNAIMWYVTGNPAYMNNAITIMMSWAHTLTSFDVTDHISAGTAVFDFANAAEIIRATGGGVWAASDITTFQNWLIAYLYPPLLTPGNSIAANVLEAAGHGGLQIKGLVSMGIFCDRQDIYNFGISSALHNGTFTYGLQEYINSGGQNYETARDQGHASGNVGSFVQTFYMAWNQGTDLFPTANNLLATGLESQARIDQRYNVVPAVWTAADGSGHNSLSDGSRTPYDNLTSDLAYYIFHTVKGMNMPFTYMSANIKYPDGGSSFMYRVDNSGYVPLASLYGEPNPKDVVIFADGDYAGVYLAHFGPGSYNAAQLNAGGVIGGPWGNGTQTISSMQVPAGWTVTAYDGDNFTGNAVVITGSVSFMGDLSSTINWNDRVTSVQITAGNLPYVISDGTYRLVNRNSGLAAAIHNNSTTEGEVLVQTAPNTALDQLWRVEVQINGQYSFLNLSNDKAMEVSGASLQPAAAVDQRTFAGLPNLASGGIASASADNATNGEGAAQAFDGSIGSKWYDPLNGGTGWLQYQFGSGKTFAVDQYWLTSASDVQQRDPAAWQFQGSNDGINWTTLDTQSAQVFAYRYQTMVYSITNPAAYSYYRLNVTANYGGSGYGIQLSEFALYSSKTGALNQRWTYAPVPGTPLGSYFNLTNLNSAYLLDVPGGSTYDGMLLVQWPANSGINQQWALTVP